MGTYSDSFLDPAGSDDTRLVDEKCYFEEVITPENSGGTNTRNVGPGLAGGFTASFAVPVDFYQMLSFRATVDGVGSGDFTVTNLTTGESVNTSVESWSGAFSALASPVFTLNAPLSGSAGDIITFTSNIAGNARWRYTFTSVSSIRQGTAGTSGNSMAGSVAGQVVIRGSYFVQTYEDVNTGDLTLVQTDENGVRSPLAAVPGTWTEVPCDPDWVKDECYSAVGTTYEYTGATNTSSNGNMSQASGAAAPSVANFRIENSGPVPFLLQGFRIRYGANGYTGNGSVTILGEVFNEVGQSDINGVYRTLDFAPANGVGVVFDVGDAHTSGGGSNHGALTGGFQGPVATAYGGDNLFPAGIIARAELDVVGGTLAPETHIVRTYEDGSLVEVDKDANTLTPLASVPADWVLQSHVECEDHTAITDRLDALEAGGYNVALNNIYSANLSSGTQDTNDATETYFWANALSGPDFVYDAATGRFTAQRGLTAQINPRIRVTNATANDRATFYVQVSRFSAANVALEETAFSGVYLRDDNGALGDDGIAAGSTSMTFAAGEYFTINSVRMSSQDSGDDNPADQNLSRLAISVWQVI